MASEAGHSHSEQLIQMLFGIELSIVGGIILSEFVVNTEILLVPTQPLGWVLVLSGLGIVLSIVLNQD